MRREGGGGGLGGVKIYLPLSSSEPTQVLHTLLVSLYLSRAQTAPPTPQAGVFSAAAVVPWAQPGLSRPEWTRY